MKVHYKEGNEKLFVLIGEENIESFKKYLNDNTVIWVDGFDWNEMLSPWPHPKVFKKGKDFQGKAHIFLDELLKHPFFKKDYKEKTILGYSLAGLFSLYACTKTDYFSQCASISGSLWYPNFKEYIQNNKIYAKRIYLSLGDTEKNTKNEILSTVEDNTRQIAKDLQEKHEVLFEMNPGNHFEDHDGKIKKALKYLTK